MIGDTPFKGRAREQIDYPLLLCALTIAVLGVVNLYSATSPYFGTSRSGLAAIYLNQLYWLAIGGLAGALVAAVDYRHIERFAYVIYMVGIFSLILVFILGRDVRGAARWIKIGSFSFQPSEFTKVGLAIALAKHLHDDPKNEPRTIRDLIVPFILTMVPTMLIARQPDLGTALVHVFIFLSVVAITRIKRGSILTVFGAGVVALPLLWTYMLPYQKQRVTAFLNPEANLAGEGYHAHQARVAIGNGGWLGNGFMNGIQNQYRFLPDQYSDFPYPVFAEEWGFVGTIVLLGLYGFLILWSIRIAALARDRFGAVLSVGCAAVIFWQTIVNLGMASGMLPVVGMTLPLFSYGGSSVITTLLAIALLMNVSMRRSVGVAPITRR